jgi:hypothetical protein
MKIASKTHSNERAGHRRKSDCHGHQFDVPTAPHIECFKAISEIDGEATLARNKLLSNGAGNVKIDQWECLEL